MSKIKDIIREQKAFPFHVKTFDDEQGIVTGYLSTFNNIDDGGDRVLPNAFKRTLTNKYEYKQKHDMKFLFPLLWQHDTGVPIGGYTEAKEDTTGLFVELQIDLDVQQGREAYSGLKKRYIFNQSMGYDVLQSEWVKVEGKSIRDLIEVRLWEGSIVTFPMNTEATVTSVKAVERVPELHTKKNVGGKQQPTTPQLKTFQEHYAEEMCEDLITDWSDVYLSALTDSVLDAFKIGDTAETDISDAIDAFKEQVMSTFVALGIEHGLSAYLTANSYSSADSTMQNGSDSPYSGWMASRRQHAHKAGRAVSAANADKIQGHVDTMHAIATKMKTHTSDLNTAADDLATILQGSEAAYGTDPGTPATPEGKAASPDEVRGAQPHPSKEDTVNEHELNAVLDSLRSLHVVS